MRATVIGLGEAGAIYTAGLLSAGWEVRGFDPADVPTPAGVERAADVAGAVAGADAVLSLVGGRAAGAVAESVAPHLGAEAVFLDMNSAAPEVKQRVGAAFAGRPVADVAVVGSVPRDGAATAVVVSGPGASRAGEVLRTLGGQVEDLGGEMGDAARRKLLRSSFMKGLGALIVETMDAADAMGAHDWALAQIGGEVKGGVEGATRLADGTRRHAARRGHEAHESAVMLDALGVRHGMVDAAARVHDALADAAEVSDADLLARARRVPVANFGDAQERQGMLHAAVAPVWDAPRVAGFARTVQVAAGDNRAIHETIPNLRPDEVLVVDGKGYTERALLGELMAARMRSQGAVGIVVDGAVRDRKDLEELRIPVWARAVTPAGPYKNGPGAQGETITAGGVVVSPGDLVVADEDGVIVVPRHRAVAALLAAEAVQADEAARRAAITGEAAR